MGGASALHPPSELLHLNQSCVQDLISDLTDLMPVPLVSKLYYPRYLVHGLTT